MPYHFVHCEQDHMPIKAGCGGKWLLWLLPSEVETVWPDIAAAVRAGHLGPEAKIADWENNGGEHVVVVYTYDHGDEADIMRIRDYLMHEVGVLSRMSYKTNEQTQSGVYRHHGHQRISQHWVRPRR